MDGQNCKQPCTRWVRRDDVNGLICDDCGAKSMPEDECEWWKSHIENLESALDKICSALGGDKNVPPWVRVQELKDTVERISSPVSGEEWVFHGGVNFSETHKQSLSRVLTTRLTAPVKKKETGAPK